MSLKDASQEDDKYFKDDNDVAISCKNKVQSHVAESHDEKNVHTHAVDGFKHFPVKNNCHFFKENESSLITKQDDRHTSLRASNDSSQQDKRAITSSNDGAQPTMVGGNPSPPDLSLVHYCTVNDGSKLAILLPHDVADLKHKNKLCDCDDRIKATFPHDISSSNRHLITNINISGIKYSENTNQSSDQKVLQRSISEGQDTIFKDREHLTFQPPIHSLVYNFLPFSEQREVYKSISMPCMNSSILNSNSETKNINFDNTNSRINKIASFSCVGTKPNKSKENYPIDVTSVSSYNSTPEWENLYVSSFTTKELCKEKEDCKSPSLLLANGKSLSLDGISFDYSDKLMEEVDKSWTKVFFEENSGQSSISVSSQNIAEESNCNMCFCGGEVQKLKKELQECKDKLASMENDMAHQSQYIQQLRKAERHRGTMQNYPDGYNYHSTSFPSSSSHDALSYGGNRSMNSSYNSSNSSSLTSGSIELSQLMDQYVALRLENSSLSESLEQERLKRRNAEVTVAKDRNYIRRLENSIQTLQTTQLVMDPETYKSVADRYIASRIKSSRTSSNHKCGQGDLVCDTLTALRKNDDWSNCRSSSCPTTPPEGNASSMNNLYYAGNNRTSNSMSSGHTYDHPNSMSSAPTYDHPKVCRTSSIDSSSNPSSPLKEESTTSSNMYSTSETKKSETKESETKSEPLQPWQYQEMLLRLENLD